VNRIFEELTQDWQDAVSHFEHASPTITASEPPAQTPQEEHMPLSADLAAAQDVARAADAPLRVLLDQHLPGLIEAAQILDNSRLVQAAIGAEHALPQPVKDALAQLLEAHAQAAPAPEQPANA
jgi:hypothetical protein